MHAQKSLFLSCKALDNVRVHSAAKSITLSPSGALHCDYLGSSALLKLTADNNSATHSRKTARTSNESAEINRVSRRRRYSARDTGTRYAAPVLGTRHRDSVRRAGTQPWP